MKQCFKVKINCNAVVLSPFVLFALCVVMQVTMYLKLLKSNSNIFLKMRKFML